MSEENPRLFKTITDWRNWLTENHADDKVIWLVLQKKASKKEGIQYEEAVIEALTYGWIEGKMKSLNEDEFKQRFTPRRKNSVWSLRNRERVEKLLAEGRMNPAGMKTVEEAKQNGRWDKATSSSRGVVDMPEELITALQKNKTAEKNFESFPPSARYIYIHWINEAKRQTTRVRRIKTVVYRAEQNQKPGIDLRVVNE